MALLDNYKVITVTHHNVNVGDIGNFYIHCEILSTLVTKLSLFLFRSELCVLSIHSTILPQNRNELTLYCKSKVK